MSVKSQRGNHSTRKHCKIPQVTAVEFRELQMPLVVYRIDNVLVFCHLPRGQMTGRLGVPFVSVNDLAAPKHPLMPIIAACQGQSRKNPLAEHEPPCRTCYYQCGVKCVL